MKGRRVLAVPTPAEVAARRRDHARQRLRTFAKFIERQDPEALAASVVALDSTLESCARIETFFRRYVQALRLRVVH